MTDTSLLVDKRKKELGDQIRYALGCYKMYHQDNKNGGTLDLVDVVTPAWEDSIAEGEIELDMLAEHIADYLEPTLTGWKLKDAK